MIYIYNTYNIPMKTQVTLTIDKDIKDKFQKIAKRMWWNMSTIANMYFTQVVKTGKIDFSLWDSEPVEVGFIELDELPASVKKKYLASKKSDKKHRINI